MNTVNLSKTPARWSSNGCRADVGRSSSVRAERDAVADVSGSAGSSSTEQTAHEEAAVRAWGLGLTSDYA